MDSPGFHPGERPGREPTSIEGDESPRNEMEISEIENVEPMIVHSHS
jgi:hypothetical protein